MSLPFCHSVGISSSRVIVFFVAFFVAFCHSVGIFKLCAERYTRDLEIPAE
jgi:hypothetical protein